MILKFKTKDKNTVIFIDTDNILLYRGEYKEGNLEITQIDRKDYYNPLTDQLAGFKPWKCLEELYRLNGDAYYYTDMWHNLWDYNDEPDPSESNKRTMRNWFSQLNNLFIALEIWGTDQDKGIIQSVRGKGYRLPPESHDYITEISREDFRALLSGKPNNTASCHDVPPPSVKNGINFSEKLDELKNKVLDAYLGPVFIIAEGGIGKTELLLRFYLLNKHNFRSVIYMTYDGSLKNTIANLSFPNYWDYDYENKLKRLDTRYQDKFRLISEADLILIDNFDVKLEDFIESDNKDSDYYIFEKLNSFYSKVVVTTRTIFNSDYSRVLLSPGSEKIWLDLYKANLFNYYQCDESFEKTFSRIYNYVQGHTLTLNLIMKMLEYSMGEIVLSELADRLEKNCIPDSSQKVNNNGKRDIIARHIQSIYNISKLTEKEIGILDFLAFLPVSGAKKLFILSALSTLYDENTFNSLVRRNWINAKGGSYSLHPILSQAQKARFKDWKMAEKYLLLLDINMSHSWEEKDQKIIRRGRFSSEEMPIAISSYLNILTSLQENFDIKAWHYFYLEIAFWYHRLADLIRSIGFEPSIAISALQNAIEIRKKISDTEHTIDYLIDLGSLYSSLGNRSKASSAFAEAEKLLLQHPPFGDDRDIFEDHRELYFKLYYASGKNVLSYSSGDGDITRAMDLFLLAKKYAFLSRERASLLIAISHCHIALNNMDLAEDVIEMMLEGATSGHDLARALELKIKMQKIINGGYSEEILKIYDDVCKFYKEDAKYAAYFDALIDQIHGYLQIGIVAPCYSLLLDAQLIVLSEFPHHPRKCFIYNYYYGCYYFALYNSEGLEEHIRDSIDYLEKALEKSMSFSGCLDSKEVACCHLAIAGCHLALNDYQNAFDSLSKAAEADITVINGDNKDLLAINLFKTPEMKHLIEEYQEKNVFTKGSHQTK